MVHGAPYPRSYGPPAATRWAATGRDRGGRNLHRQQAGREEGRSTHHKHAVYTLVERNGRARSFHVDKVTAAKLDEITRNNVSLESTFNTDEALRYVKMGKGFKGGHQVVNHGKGDYGQGEHTTNTVEGYFSIFKRGMKGVYQHCDERHLHRSARRAPISVIQTASRLALTMQCAHGGGAWKA